MKSFVLYDSDIKLRYVSKKRLNRYKRKYSVNFINMELTFSLYQNCRLRKIKTYERHFCPYHHSEYDLYYLKSLLEEFNGELVATFSDGWLKNRKPLKVLFSKSIRGLALKKKKVIDSEVLGIDEKIVSNCYIVFKDPPDYNLFKLSY